MADFDVVIRNGRVVDGTGALVLPMWPFAATRLLKSGRSWQAPVSGKSMRPGCSSRRVGRSSHALRRPVTWDKWLTPSSWHGVTTAIMGNCGVGFAPAHPDRHDWLIQLMEGVEDIPGSALTEGLTWGGNRFPSTSTRSRKFEGDGCRNAGDTRSVAGVRHGRSCW